jgi:hypothetical protein
MSLELIKQHAEWLSNNKVIKPNLSNVDLSYANLSYANLRNANLSDANLRNANLSDANLSKVDLSNVDLSYANLRNANLRNANLRNANLSDADLSNADLRNANLRNADLSNVDLSYANLSYANLRNANLSDANLSNVDLSNVDLSYAIGLLSPINWIENNFEKSSDGIIVYKVIGGTDYLPNNKWLIKSGSILEEECNPTRTINCACGVNFGTLEWCQNYTGDNLWKCLIRWEWLVDVIVPYHTDGKARCSKLQLIEIVEKICLK